MSKVDAQRALRDARYARFAAARAAETVPTKSPAAKPAKAAAAKPAAEPTSEELFSAVPAPTKKSDRPAAGASKSSPFAEVGASPSAATSLAEPDQDVAGETGSQAAVAAESGSASESAATSGPVTTDPGAEVVEATSATAGAESAKAEPAVVEESAEPQADEELCGHRSMNGRSCTRTKGHEQKNHRYN
jgi:hypothetical protein